MRCLTIKLTGTVDASNFSEWKKELVGMIQSSVTTLVTDDDFVTALRHVASLKAAEKTLKQAKQSAIEQASDIQRLFSAIDEISNEARQARLSLERQINSRKHEIKAHIIQSGIDSVQRFIDKQREEFKYIDKSSFVDRSRFESAIRGRSGTKGVQFAIDHLCSQIIKEVADKAIALSNNKARIDAMPAIYRLLFQDWKSLIDLPEAVLEAEMHRRIARYNDEIARKGTVRSEFEFNTHCESGTCSEAVVATQAACEEPQRAYRIQIDILSTLEKAKALARAVRASYGSDSSIVEIKLTTGAPNQGAALGGGPVH